MAMQLAEMDREFEEANPWWKDPFGWQAMDVALRRAAAAPFEYHPKVLDNLTPGGLHILRGPRRVGKSTEMRRLADRWIAAGADPRSVICMSVEGRSAQDLEDLIRRATDSHAAGHAGHCLWLIDEVTSVIGDWPAAIKRLRDRHPSFSDDTVVLTGSSTAQFDNAVKALVGRRNADHPDRVMTQMPFVDVAAALGHDLPESPALVPHQLADKALVKEMVSKFRPWVTSLVDAWEEYLFVGGYPQMVAAHLSGDKEGQTVMRNALWDVIHGDAFSGATMTQTQTLTLLRRLTTSLTSLLSINSVAEEVSIDQKTAANRLDALRRNFIAFPVHREAGLAPKPKSQSKWYFTDPALAGLAAHFGSGPNPDRTALSEQQLACALLRALERRSPGATIRHDQLLYYRSGTQAEIDFVSRDFTRTCLESKYVDSGWGRAFQTIEAAGYECGIVATRSGLAEHDAGWALPAGLIVFLLGV